MVSQVGSIHIVIFRSAKDSAGCHAHGFAWACFAGTHAHAKPWAWHPNSIPNIFYAMPYFFSASVNHVFNRPKILFLCGAPVWAFSNSASFLNSCSCSALKFCGVSTKI